MCHRQAAPAALPYPQQPPCSHQCALPHTHGEVSLGPWDHSFQPSSFPCYFHASGAGRRGGRCTCVHVTRRVATVVCPLRYRSMVERGHNVEEERHSGVRSCPYCPRLTPGQILAEWFSARDNTKFRKLWTGAQRLKKGLEPLIWNKKEINCLRKSERENSKPMKQR